MRSIPIAADTDLEERMIPKRFEGDFLAGEFWHQ